MSEPEDKSAEEAFAAAAEKVTALAVQAKPAAPEVAIAPVKQAAPKAKPKAKPVALTAKAKPVSRPKPKAAPKPAPAAKKLPVKKPEFTQLKEKKMAKTTDFTAPMTEAMTDMQDKAKAAYEKSTVMATELGEFTKGNVEAMVESGKILSSAMQDMGKTVVEDAKSAFETMTGDMKEMAAVKSPTDLFQLQSKLMRRNFDALIAFGSKTSESMVKLANDAAAPISSRVSVAAEKVSKAA